MLFKWSWNGAISRPLTQKFAHQNQLKMNLITLEWVNINRKYLKQFN